jgi:hypothetical protein
MYPQFQSAIDKQILGSLITKKQAAGLKDQADYIQSKLPK